MPRLRRPAGLVAVPLAVLGLAVGIVVAGGIGVPGPAATSAVPSGAALATSSAAPTAQPSIAVSPSPDPSGIVSAPLSQLAAAHPTEVGKFNDGGDVGDEPQLPALPGPHSADTVVQHTPGAGGVKAPLTPVPSPSTSWAALGAGFTGPAGTMAVNLLPPDTSIGVGMNQVVETVNFRLAVFGKATGAVLLGPVSLRTLFAGFGGLCETAEDGDATALYDRAADRWVLTWFAGYGVSDGTSIPYLECVAVSSTGDATGAWARYAFGYSMLNDYPKLAVWRDSYVATFNMFDIANGSAYKGPKVCAYDRTSMLAGVAVRDQQCFDLPPLPVAQGGAPYSPVLPATVDSFDQPPAGAPVPIVGLADTTDLGTWKLAVDWSTPGNSALTGPVLVPVPVINDACNGSSCVPQPGTTTAVASMGGRVMQRLAYRIDGGVERMALTHSVGGGSAAQVRWYELGISGAGRAVSVINKGTYAPDASFRWMGSAARDWAGDLAVGYALSSGSIYPSLAVAGRLPGDPADTLGQAERVLFSGTGSQNGQYDRWGDYTTMALDPADDCTFWYAGQYYGASHAYNWRTRIVSFAFPSCTPSRLLTLSIAGNAAGTVTSDVAGINCSASCKAVWPSGTTVVLTAHPAPGSTFDGWSGACSGTATCSVTMSAAASVGALFNDHTPPEGTVARPAAATNAATLTFTLAFSEAVQGVDAVDLSVGGTATGCVIGTPAGTATTWTVDVTGCSEGTVNLTLLQATVPDLVGNLGPTSPSASQDVIVDRTAPTVDTAPVITLRAGVSLASAATTSPVPMTVTWAASDTGGAGLDHVVLERSTNGGTIWTVASPAAPGTSAAVTAAPAGTVIYRATAYDAAGNVSAVTAGAAVAPQLVQQNSSAVKYTSVWYTLTSTSRSAKTDKWSRTKWASATFTFTGRSVALVALRGTGRGLARIYVGNVLVATVNLYRSATQARYVAWAKDWGVSAKRVVKIVVIPSAKGPRVDLDGFVILK